MEGKGISPLVAAVILIAIVMTIAAVLSGFLTDFVDERVYETEEETGTLVDCTGISLEIREDSVNVDDDEGEVSFILYYQDGDEPLPDLRVTTLNEDDEVETDTNPEPREIEPLTPKRITANVTVDDPNEIWVFSRHCPDDEYKVEEMKENEWSRIF
ncbi:MAG: archaellin/type IV pilin N-terminal domain-containing protein [Candidatus Aenigmatarchaeota archaeon]